MCGHKRIQWPWDLQIIDAALLIIFFITLRPCPPPLLATVLVALAVFCVHDSRPAAAQQSPPLPLVTVVYADTLRAADAAAVRNATSAASALANFHADIAADHTTAGSDRHCHHRVNVCHSYLDSEPYARSAEGVRSAADAHARAALKAGTITSETAARGAEAAASADARALATAAADAAWAAVHKNDMQASVRHAADGIIYASSNYPRSVGVAVGRLHLTIVRISSGTATITVTAHTSDAFDVTVVNPYLDQED